MVGMTSLPRRRADAVSNRAAVLDAATRVLVADPQASMADVAAAAGVARRTLYGHFSSREDLVTAIAGRVVEGLRACVQRWDAEPEPLLRLAGYLHDASRYVADLHPLSGLARSSAAQTGLEAVATSVRPWLTATVEEALATGRLDRSLSPQLAAHLTTALTWATFDAVAAGHLTDQAAPALAVRTVLRALGADAAEIERLEAAL
jgi:AcrR family transcriptional regulator